MPCPINVTLDSVSLTITQLNYEANLNVFTWDIITCQCPNQLNYATILDYLAMCLPFIMFELCHQLETWEIVRAFHTIGAVPCGHLNITKPLWPPGKLELPVLFHNCTSKDNRVLLLSHIKKQGKIYCSTFQGHHDSIIKRLVKSHANKEKYKMSKVFVWAIYCNFSAYLVLFLICMRFN